MQTSFCGETYPERVGDYGPEGLPHLNNTVSWGCLGVDLGANTIFDDAIFIFFGNVVTPKDLQIEF